MLTDDLQNDLKEAQLARDEIKVSTLRMLLSEIKNAEIAKSGQLDEAGITVVVQKEAKKRKEAAAGFRSGGREEAALKEEVELKVLEGYLPTQLSDEALTDLVDQAINEVGASGIQDMGKIVGLVMGKVTGQADGGRVSGIVREKLI